MREVRPLDHIRGTLPSFCSNDVREVSLSVESLELERPSGITIADRYSLCYLSANSILTILWVLWLTYFSPMSHFYTP